MAASINVKELYQRYQAGDDLDIIDVRTPAEYQSILHDLLRIERL